MRRRSSSSAMPPANLIGTIRLGRGKNRSCAVASEFDVIYECCPLVSTVFLFTRLLGNYLRKVEKTQHSVRRRWKPTDVQLSENRNLWTRRKNKKKKKKRKRKESLDWKTKSRKNKENNEVGEARYKGGKDAYIHRTRASNAKYKSGTKKKKKRPSSR